jgi:phospholipase C
MIVAACGGGDDSTSALPVVDGGSGADGGGDGSLANGDGSSPGEAGACASCPTGYSCGTFNGIQACASPAGIPLFDHVFLAMMENLSYSTLDDAINQDASATANLHMVRDTYASGDDYHGAHSGGQAVHPSLPNYISITSGDPQGVACDCQPIPEAGTCGTFSCTLVTGDCACNQAVPNVADQIETATKTWKAYGEDMGTPCNLTDQGNYAVRHVPFLYYDAVRENAARCTSHIVDFTNFATDLAGTSAPNFLYVAPNLIDDGHNPQNPADHSTNIADVDTFLGTFVPAVTASNAYKNGGLLIIVWDEDNSNGIFSNDDPIPIFVLSPYAKKGFVSHVTADHASLLATIEDGLGLPRLGQAATAQPLVDYFK